MVNIFGSSKGFCELDSMIVLITANQDKLKSCYREVL
jgi:hypothetical protein